MYISFCQHRPICRISGPDKQDSRHRIPKTTTADAILRQILLLMAHLLRSNSALSGLFFQLDLLANSAGGRSVGTRQGCRGSGPNRKQTRAKAEPVVAGQPAGPAYGISDLRFQKGYRMGERPPRQIGCALSVVDDDGGDRGYGEDASDEKQRAFRCKPATLRVMSFLTRRSAECRSE